MEITTTNVVETLANLQKSKVQFTKFSTENYQKFRKFGKSSI